MVLKKQANFWIRSIARLIDMTLFSLLIVLLAWAFTTPNPLRFKEDWLFYAWIFISLILILIIWFVIPLLFNGKTIGNIITRIELSYEGSLIKILIRRESIMSLGWATTIVLVCVFANHTGFMKMFSTKEVSLTTMEVLRLSVIRSFGIVLAMIQLISGASLLISSSRSSIIDKTTKSKIVWINKYEEVEHELKGPQPRIVKRQKIEFVD